MWGVRCRCAPDSHDRAPGRAGGRDAHGRVVQPHGAQRRLTISLTIKTRHQARAVQEHVGAVGGQRVGLVALLWGWGLGLEAWGLGLGVWGLGFGVVGVVWVWCSGFGIGGLS